MKTQVEQHLTKRIKFLIWIFIIGLCLSGMTAFPIFEEISFLHSKILPLLPSFMKDWIEIVYKGVAVTNNSHSFIFYGTDWLAFAHIVIAVAFIGPLIDPVRNIWVIQFGRIACFMIFPLAFVCGAIRGIPFWWQLIDCSFGVGGLIILTSIYCHIQKLESLINNIKTQTT